MTTEEFMNEHGNDYYCDAHGVWHEKTFTHGECVCCGEDIEEDEQFGSFDGKLFHKKCVRDFATDILDTDELFKALNDDG